MPLLAKVPLTMPLREQSDAGVPLVFANPDDPAAQAIRQAARGLIALSPIELPVMQAPAPAAAPKPAGHVAADGLSRGSLGPGSPGRLAVRSGRVAGPGALGAGARSGGRAVRSGRGFARAWWRPGPGFARGAGFARAWGSASGLDGRLELCGPLGLQPRLIGPRSSHPAAPLQGCDNRFAWPAVTTGRHPAGPGTLHRAGRGQRAV